MGWTVLAVAASLFFPGAGQALTGRMRRTVLWSVAGALSILAILVVPYAILILWLPVRLGAAIDAWIAVQREKPGGKHRGFAGAVAGIHLVFLMLIQLLALESFKIPASSMAPTVM